MIRTRAKSVYDYRGYRGPDVDIETSLREYGLIWTRIKGDEYRFIYGLTSGMGTDCEYRRFTDAFMTRCEFGDILREAWFHADDVMAFCGAYKSIEGMEKAFPGSMQDAIAYHGAENMFGSDYSMGYPIGR